MSVVETGGTGTFAFFYDAAGHPCEREQAVRAIISEYEDGVLVSEADMRLPAAVVAAGTFTESKHRRYPTGTKVRGKEGGGRFAPKATTAQPTGKEEEVTDLRGKDTEALYTDENGRWTEERQKLHRGIKQWFLDTAEKNGAVKQEHPEALFMAGGSGAGKSSVLESMDDAPEGYVTVNPDLVKEMIPEYEEMKNAGDPRAAEFTHEESSFLAKEIAKEAQARGYNMVVDGTGDSGEGKFFGKIEAAEAAGYTTNVVLVDIPADEAWNRAVIRARKSGRLVPKKDLYAIHSSVSARHIEWRDKVANWTVYENDSFPPDPKVIAFRQDNGKIKVVNRARYEQFLKKAEDDTGGA